MHYVSFQVVCFRKKRDRHRSQTQIVYAPLVDNFKLFKWIHMSRSNKLIHIKYNLSFWWCLLFLWYWYWYWLVGQQRCCPNCVAEPTEFGTAS